MATVNDSCGDVYYSVPQGSPKAKVAQVTPKANKVARETEHLELTSPKTLKLSSEATPSQNCTIATLDFWNAARECQEGPYVYLMRTYDQNRVLTVSITSLPKLVRKCVTPQQWESIDPVDEKDDRIRHFLRYDEAKQEIWIVDLPNPDHNIPNTRISRMVDIFVSAMPAAHQVYDLGDESTILFQYSVCLWFESHFICLIL